MPLFARATARLADLPSLSTSTSTRSRPRPPPRAPTPTSTPPLSSASHTSTTSSSSGPSTPPATDLDPSLDLDARPVKLGGSDRGAPSLGSSRSGHHKLRASRSRSRSESRTGTGTRTRAAGDDSERAGRVGRFFKRIASRKSLRGDGDGEDGEGDEGDKDKDKVPALPSLPPRLELLELPSLGAAFELSGPAAPAPAPVSSEARPADAGHELSSLTRLVHAAADNAASSPASAPGPPAPEPEPEPKSAQPALAPFSRLKKRLSRLALPSTSSSRPLSTAVEGVDAHGEASDEGEGRESEDEDDDEALVDHAWLSAPARPGPAAAASHLTPPTSPLYPSPPRTPLSAPPRSPFLARDYDPTVERLFAHTRARLAPPAPASALALASPSSASSTSSGSSSPALIPPFSASALPGPASTHPHLLSASPSSAAAARPRRAQALRTLLAHHTLRAKLERGVTLGDRAELARTSSAPAHGPPSLPPAPAPAPAALGPLPFPLPRLREWAARPPFVERARVHTASAGAGAGAGGEGRTDVVRARLRDAPVPLGSGTRAWLEAMGAAQDAAAAAGGSEREWDPAAARRPAREAPPRATRQGPSPSSSPVGAWLVAEYSSRPLPAPPVSVPVRAPLGPTPGPLLRRQLARQDAEARLNGACGVEEAVRDEQDEDERPLATLPRSPQRTSRLLPPVALGPPLAYPPSPHSRSRPMTPTQAPSSASPSPFPSPATTTAHELAAAQRKTARLEAELGRLRAREAHRQREEDCAARERAVREERARGRTAEEQRRRTRAMTQAEARRRSTTPGPGAEAGQIPHSQSCGAYLAVPLHGHAGVWSASALGPPLYHQPLHVLSAPDLQALQRQQALGRPLAPQQQRYSLAPPSPSPSPSGPLPAPPPPRPQRNSLRAPPHPLPHSRSTPNIALSPPRARSPFLAPPPPPSAPLPLEPPRAAGPSRRASHRPSTPLVTLEAA